mmetsp:Transcript_116180/g.323572  ORF Transcript_116180/g.323572 Transcript_116180/m.323572 type:complete len:208 (-) Transcript_116180:13-636(-)
MHRPAFLQFQRPRCGGAGLAPKHPGRSRGGRSQLFHQGRCGRNAGGERLRAADCLRALQSQVSVGDHRGERLPVVERQGHPRHGHLLRSGDHQRARAPRGPGEQRLHLPWRVLRVLRVPGEMHTRRLLPEGRGGGCSQLIPGRLRAGSRHSSPLSRTGGGAQCCRGSGVRGPEAGTCGQEAWRNARGSEGRRQGPDVGARHVREVAS